jgi:glutamate carboxypeptidase
LSTWCREQIDELLDDLPMLVGHESPSADKALLDATASSIRSWLAVRLGPPTDSARHELAEHGDILKAAYRGTSARSVLLIGHYDTVWPAGTLLGRPFTVCDGRASGPGVYDMKAGLVTGVWALRALRALNTAGEGAVEHARYHRPIRHSPRRLARRACRPPLALAGPHCDPVRRPGPS